MFCKAEVSLLCEIIVQSLVLIQYWWLKQKAYKEVACTEIKKTSTCFYVLKGD